MRQPIYVLPLAASLLGGCMTGPPPQGASSPVPALRPRGADVTAPAVRALIDSLGGPARSAAVPGGMEVDPTRDLAWLDVLRDPQLVALVNQAVANNRSLAVAEGRVREFRGQVGVARSDLFPQLSANANQSRNRTAAGPTALEFDAVRVTGDASWELDFWGRARRGTQAARFDLGARQEDARAITLLLVADVATAYLQMRELDENVVLAEQTLVSRRATLELARQRFGQGVTSELEVRQFEAELAEPAARVADFARQRTEAENRLALLLGRGPGAIPRGRPLGEVVQAIQVPDSLPGTLIAGRPDVRAAERTLQASQARIGQVRAARLPAVSLGGQYGSQRSNVASLLEREGEIYTFQVGVAVPLFTGGRQRGEEVAVRARSDQARMQYEETVLTALREADDALAGVHTGRDQLSARQGQVRALQEALSIAQLRYRAGVSSYLEVLDPQRQLFAAQLARVQAERQYLAAIVTLYRALGGGWGALR